MHIYIYILPSPASSTDKPGCDSIRPAASYPVIMLGPKAD
jgi:hypothetical protein